VPISRRAFLQWAGLAGAAAALSFRPSLNPSATQLRLLTTTRALSTTLVDAFTRETGVPLTVVLADNPIELADADLAIIPAQALTAFVKLNAVQQLGSVPSSVAFEQRAYDPLNAFSLPAARGVIGINARGVSSPQSWRELFELATVHPTHLPAAETFGASLKMQGHSLNTRDYLARKNAKELVSQFTSTPLEQATLAIGAPLEGWQFTVPNEGAEQWEDCFCIPANSTQPHLARTFVAFALAHQPPMALPTTVPLEMRSPFAPPLG
jgi:spermidine/putrescine-binding protein